MLAWRFVAPSTSGSWRALAYTYIHIHILFCLQQADTKNFPCPNPHQRATNCFELFVMGMHRLFNSSGHAVFGCLLKKNMALKTLYTDAHFLTKLNVGTSQPLPAKYLFRMFTPLFILKSIFWIAKGDEGTNCCYFRIPQAASPPPSPKQNPASPPPLQAIRIALATRAAKLPRPRGLQPGWSTIEGVWNPLLPPPPKCLKWEMMSSWSFSALFRARCFFQSSPRPLPGKEARSVRETYLSKWKARHRSAKESNKNSRMVCAKTRVGDPPSLIQKEPRTLCRSQKGRPY